MRRIKFLAAAVGAAALLALPAGSSAKNSGTPPGPPGVSGGSNGTGAEVVHFLCGQSVLVFNKNGQSGNCD